MVEEVVSAAKRKAKKPLIVKLSPNVTDITEIARAAVAAGADALSLINTLLGMRIDIETRRPILSNVMGGLSGPAVFPVAVRMVYQVRRAVDVPILGMGGIRTGRDIVEMLLAGADAVAMGTVLFADPLAPVKALQELEAWMDAHGVKSVRELSGRGRGVSYDHGLPDPPRGGRRATSTAAVTGSMTACSPRAPTSSSPVWPNASRACRWTRCTPPTCSARAQPPRRSPSHTG